MGMRMGTGMAMEMGMGGRHGDADGNAEKRFKLNN